MTKITQILNDGDVVNEGHFQQIKDVVNTNDDIATPLSVAYSTTVRADRIRFKSKHTMTGAVALTLDTTGAINGLGETIPFVGDGNNITISGGTIVPSQNATIATTAGVELLLVLVWGGSYWQVGIEGTNSIAPPSIIVMQYDFAGNTRDTAKWTENNAADELDISQNDQLEFTANGTPAGAIDMSANNYESKFSFVAGTNKQSYQYDISAFAGNSNKAHVIPVLRLHDGTLDNRIQIDQSVTVAENDKVRFRIWLGGVNQYDFSSSISLLNTFKVEIDGTSISFYYLNASTWIQIGVTQTVDFTGISFIATLGATISVNAVVSDQAIIDNYYQTNDNYTIPVPS